MPFITLDNDFIAELLANEKPPQEVPAHEAPRCSKCDTELDNGYCVNVECDVDAPIPTFPCEYCGHCSNPGHCVQSISCPECGSDPSSLCIDRRGGLTGFHEERWQVVKERYGVYYK